MNRFKELRQRNGLTLKQVADKLGFAESTVQRYETGKIENLKYDTIVKLANIYRVSPAYLMGWEEGSGDAPVYEVAAGEGRTTEWYAAETMSLKLQDGESIVRVVGRSMEPTLLNGDKVIVKAQDYVDSMRQIALVKINGDEATLKRVDMRPNGILLIADNMDVYEPHFYTAREVKHLPVRVVGVVTRLIRELD